MSSQVDEIIQKLMERGLSEEEIESQVHKKAQEYGGFMSTQGVLFIIAKEHGIKLYSSEIDQEIYNEIEEGIDYNDFTIQISQVKEGMQNIVVLGKIVRIFQIREFLRKDGRVGQVGSFILRDVSGTIKIVLWDNKAEIMRNKYFKKGEIVRIVSGYSKPGKDSNLEVHLGRKGTINIAPNDIKKKEKAQLESINISRVYKNNSIIKGKVNNFRELIDTNEFIKEIQGIVHIEEFKEVNSKNGDKIFLLKLIISYDLNSIRVIIWGMPAVEYLKIIDEGVKIYITNLKVKNNSYTNEKELLFTKNSYLQVIE